MICGILSNTVVYRKFIINVDELYRVKTVLLASETSFLVAISGRFFETTTYYSENLEELWKADCSKNVEYFFAEQKWLLIGFEIPALWS